MTRAEVLAAWEQGKAASGDENTETKAVVAFYRLAYRTALFAPKECFFWLASTRLHMEADVGPDALVNGKEYLGPLWDRKDAIYRNHGWPKDDEDGDLWIPEEHVNPLPEDYMAWSEEF
ncbi:MAG: hypothetical protein IMZ44_12750, partial [Planctomycetes bacterium]|nr:hypothetical protein [Planctomycetota bacterium]